MTVAVVSRASIKGTLTTSRDAGDATVALDEGWAKDVTNGTGADQANAAYVDAFSIALSSSMTVDLSGSLADPNNNTTVFAAIKEIQIEADATNTNDIIVGNATNAWLGPLGATAHTIAVKPGGVLKFANYSAAGWAVGAGATDELKLANSAAGSAVTGRITVIGEV